MADKNINNEELDSSNIFDDFITDKDLVDEVNKIKEQKRKDKYYYLNKGAKFFQFIFWIGFVIVIVLFSYLKIQENPTFSNSKILTPICNIFVGDVKVEGDLCSSISSLEKLYKDRLENIKKEKTVEIFSILEDIYKVKYFTKSKEVLFLVEKSKNKGEILFVLDEFDKIKNNFYKFDKQKIQCNSLLIDTPKKELSMSCSAFSVGYEKGIRGFDGGTDKTLKGTSISIANSFLNYIDVKSDTFKIIDKQKLFKSENIVGEKIDFTNRTDFDLKLKYNLK